MATDTPSKCDVCPVVGPDCIAFVAPNVCVLIRSGRTDHRDNAMRQAGELPPLRLPTEAQKSAVNTCLYRQCQSGCLMSVCWASRAGMKRLGQPGTEVSTYDCIACLDQNTGANA